ncbi:hypothetical protein ACSBR2_015012 [Camellia fascicularis]
MPALLISSAGSAIIDLTTLTSAPRKYFTAHLEELDQLLKAIAQVKELTLRMKDYLVSFGECMSTRIFAAYLNKIGVKARQDSLVFENLYSSMANEIMKQCHTEQCC